MKINEDIFGQTTEPGPLPSFYHYSERPLDTQSSTNSLSRGEAIVGAKTEIIEDDYFDEHPSKEKEYKTKLKRKKKKYPDDDIDVITSFKEFLKEGHSDIGLGTMGFQEAPGGGMHVNSPGEVTTGLFGAGEYVAGSITMNLEDPYFAEKDVRRAPKKSKRKSRNYKISKIDKTMNFKEFLKTKK